MQAIDPFPLTQLPKARRGSSTFRHLMAFTLRDYLRSPWPVFNLVVLVAIHGLFFNVRSGQGHLFSIQYAATMFVAAVTTGVLFSRAHRAETYPVLARPVPSALLAGVLMLNAWLVAVVWHALSLLVEAVRFGAWLNPPADNMFWRGDPLAYLRGSLPALAGAAFAVGLIALLAPMISSGGARLGILALLAVLIMSFDYRNFPIVALRPVLEQLPPLLAPVAGALKYATDALPEPLAGTLLAILAGYAVVLWLAVLWLSATREMILD